MLKKIVYGIMSLGAVFLASPVFADTVSISVEVDPNPIKVSEFADVTIKALDESGNVDTGASDLDIWIEVEGFDYTDQDVVIPGGGIGFIEASDLGVKIFSKGLTIKKPGTYTLKVVSVYDDSIMGEAEVQVLADSTGPAQGTLTVTTPENNAILTSDVLDVVGATSFPNTPIVLLVDGVQFQEGLSDQQGDFSVNVTGIEPGLHTLEVNALNLDDQVVASSGPISFEYKNDTGPLFLGVEVAPHTVVKVREDVTFTIKTAERVTSALIAVGDDATMVPTTNVGPGLFEKTMSFDTPGTYPVDVTLQVGATPTVFEDVEALVVQDEVRKIITLDNTDDVEKSRSDLVWTYEGKIDYFKVRYGTNKNNLRLSLTTSKAAGTLILAEPTQAYYAQVFPVDENGIVNGEPSEIIQIGPLEEAEPICGNGIVEAGEECDDGNLINGDSCDSLCVIEIPEAVCGNGVLEDGEQCDDGNIFNDDACSSLCVVQQVQVCGNGTIEGDEACDDGNLFNNDGCSALCAVEEEEEEEEEKPAAPQTCYTDGITLSTTQINGKYYITWASVPYAREYVVYRADQAVGSLAQMRIVTKTTDTMFEYPFDPNAEADKWAWYAVEAVCDETDEQKQVGDIEKVKVGPEHTIMFLILLAIIAFGGVRIVRGMRD